MGLTAAQEIELQVAMEVGARNAAIAIGKSFTEQGLTVSPKLNGAPLSVKAHHVGNLMATAPLGYPFDMPPAPLFDQAIKNVLSLNKDSALYGWAKEILALFEGVLARERGVQPIPPGVKPPPSPEYLLDLLAPMSYEEPEQEEGQSPACFSGSVAAADEVDTQGPAAFNFFSGSSNNPGAGWGGSSSTNEGGFATVDSSGTITSTLTGSPIGNTAISPATASNQASMGGNEAE